MTFTAVLFGHVLIFERHIALLCSVMVVDHIPRNPINPCGQPILVVESADVLVNPQEDFLEQIIRHMLIGDPAANKLPQVVVEL